MKFKPEDFGGLANEFWFPEMLAIANARLEQMLSEAPVVYADKRHAEIQNVWVPSKPGNTHTARLVDIQEIKK